MNIYDEAIETLENSKACTGFPCDYPNVIKALERAKKVEELLKLHQLLKIKEKELRENRVVIGLASLLVKIYVLEKELEELK